MKRKELIKLVAVAIAACWLGVGCAGKRVVFATKSQLGLDVSGTAQMPDKISFTYGRFEGAIVPRSSDGHAYSVYGALDSDVRFFGDSTIEQTFTTGHAAKIAASKTKSLPEDPQPTNAFSTKSLFFVTDTSYGLKLSAGKQDLSPTLMLGYKRVEGAVIPVDDHEPEVRSVYADITINSSTDMLVAADSGAPLPRNRGVRIVQRFATGDAAVGAASNSKIQRALSEKISPESQAAAETIEDAAVQARKRIVDAVASGGNADETIQVDQQKLAALAAKTPVFAQPLTNPQPQTARDLVARLKNLGAEATLEISEGLDN